MRKIFTIVVTLLSTFCFSQQEQIDNIKRQLTKNATDSLKIKLWGDLGWYYSNISIDSAFKYSRKSLDLSIKTKNQNGIAQSFNDIGIIHYRIAEFDSSIAFYKRALNIRSKLKDSARIAAIYSKIGIAYNQLFKLDSAIYYSLESLKLYENLGLERFVAVSHNNLANLYRDTKQYDKALSTHQKALLIRNKINDQSGKVQSYVGIGNLYFLIKEQDSAQLYYEKSIALGERLKMIRELSTSYNNLGSLYKEKNQFKKAKSFFSKAKETRLLLRDNYGLASTELNLGDLYLRESRYSASNKSLHKALRTAKDIKADELQLNIYRAFIQVKASQKQKDSTIFYFDLYSSLQDSLLNKEVLSQISNYEMKYETVKKEKEIAIQKQEILNQELKLKGRNLYILIISSFLIIVLIISFSIYRREQFKKLRLQKEMELKEALAEIQTKNKLQEQRLEISRDLHDNIGSQLTFIISSIDNLKYVSKNVNDNFKNKLSTISGFTSDTIHQLRDTIWAMNKSEIHFEEFQSRLMSYVEKAKLISPEIKFKISVSKIQHTFSSVEGMHLFRIIQEAINNSIKYAEASEITIEITKSDARLKFLVSDNGIGFEKEEVQLGNGLENMEFRVQKIGGHFKIDSEKGKGTTITINI